MVKERWFYIDHLRGVLTTRGWLTATVRVPVYWDRERIVTSCEEVKKKT